MARFEEGMKCKEKVAAVVVRMSGGEGTRQAITTQRCDAQQSEMEEIEWRERNQWDT